ncbi:hypothetical protein [Roseiflexus sp. RS-1]|uniref:hypothetical protein n=1 Tax=Roseiflexus sp. (strain RS-1) TaxID=357808 RepID=UPI0000D82CC7|nr:hypothetical protein [Roseiflexus sp. RS-1]ABQ89601.1 hypothetical protein RoseRS_1194 [Roseiflexus sp. RS-1]
MAVASGVNVTGVMVRWRDVLAEELCAYVWIEAACAGVDATTLAPQERLLRLRHPEAVSLWLGRWKAEGIKSLPIRDRRRRTSTFSS